MQTTLRADISLTIVRLKASPLFVELFASPGTHSRLSDLDQRTRDAVKYMTIATLTRVRSAYVRDAATYMTIARYALTHALRRCKKLRAESLKTE